jgi:hypothetical protein
MKTSEVWGWREARSLADEYVIEQWKIVVFDCWAGFS